MQENQYSFKKRVVKMENDGMVIKASFRACAIDDRKKFYKSTCILPISVGQPVHENEKFFATLKLINSKFKRCTLLVDDTIQRFTLQIGNPTLTIDKAYKQAIELGDLWMKRNQHIYTQLTIPYTIKRWDYWRNLPEYITCYKKVEEFYNNDAQYKQAIHDNVEEFVTRCIQRLNVDKIDKDQAFNNCLLYLKEECAVMSLWMKDKYDFEVYPAGRNKAMSATYEKIIKPANPDLLRSVALRFKKHRKLLTT